MMMLMIINNITFNFTQSSPIIPVIRRSNPCFMRMRNTENCFFSMYCSWSVFTCMFTMIIQLYFPSVLKIMRNPRTPKSPNLENKPPFKYFWGYSSPNTSLIQQQGIRYKVQYENTNIQLMKIQQAEVGKNSIHSS